MQATDGFHMSAIAERAAAVQASLFDDVVHVVGPGAILAGVKKNEWDVTFLVSDPARLAEADFSPPYMDSDFTYLVPAGSSKRVVAELDQAGTRIAVPRGTQVELDEARRVLLVDRQIHLLLATVRRSP
jgi:ABC-type amino acid transport substrate-binding protein